MSKAWPVRKLKPKKSVRHNARQILHVRIDEVFSYSEIIPDEANITELHNARIAAKRLRYTLELFDFVFGKPGKDAIDELKDWQELLGQIHDLDVRIELIGSLLARKKGVSVEQRAGLNRMLDREQKSRIQMHRAVVQKWNDLDRAGFEDHLRNLV
jgi:CHAD domain-containing protein